MAPINILSLNVKGLNSLHKWVKAFQIFASLKVGVVALQETQFAVRTTPKFFSSRYPQVFTASATTKHRECNAGLPSHFNIHLSCQDQGPEGHYIILVGLLQDLEMTFVSYYAPNVNTNPFFSHLLQIIRSHCKGTLFMCGDSNQVLHSHLYKSPYAVESHCQGTHQGRDAESCSPCS